MGALKGIGSGSEAPSLEAAVFYSSMRNELRSESRIATFLFPKRRVLPPVVRKRSMSFVLERISSFSLLDRMLSFKVCLSDPLIGI